VGTGEFVREAVRKPYVVYNVVLGNQILPEEVPRLQQSGVLAGGTWTRALLAEQYPGLIDDGQLDVKRLTALDHKDRVALGQVLFQYQCNDCHAAALGYSAVGPLVRGRSVRMIQEMVLDFETTHFYMPPWSGTSDEAGLLAEYLAEIAPPWPQGMRPESLDRETD
ncbi:MAG: cytochrome c, partial [Pirellulales bacterium]|nr:cytochrome c [Pirellulales bacterium]